MAGHALNKEVHASADKEGKGIVEGLSVEYVCKQLDHLYCLLVLIVMLWPIHGSSSPTAAHKMNVGKVLSVAAQDM